MTHLQAEYLRAAARSEMLWQTALEDNAENSPLTISGELYGEKLQEYVKSRNDDETAEDELRPYAGKNAPRAELYTNQKIPPDVWLREVLAGKRRTKPDEDPMRPNAEQEKVLRRLLARVLEESRLEQTDAKAQSKAEPLRDLVHGCPGTGKSAMTAWIRDLFENVLGWEHGVQFVFLSFQNTMAADINGFTIHHWAGIDPTAADGSTTTKDNHKMSNKCQNLRYVIIDEISMVSAQLLGTLDRILAKAIRRKSGYKMRPDGTERPFGGINLMMLGDFWQLPPVSGTSLCAHHEVVPTGLADLGYKLLWEHGINGIQAAFDLKEPMRCDDAWYNSFLDMCRYGTIDLDTYAFLHGWPTEVPVEGRPSSFAIAGGEGMPMVRERGRLNSEKVLFKTGEKSAKLACISLL